MRLRWHCISFNRPDYSCPTPIVPYSATIHSQCHYERVRQTPLDLVFSISRELLLVMLICLADLPLIVSLGSDHPTLSWIPLYPNVPLDGSCSTAANRSPSQNYPKFQRRLLHCWLRRIWGHYSDRNPILGKGKSRGRYYLSLLNRWVIHRSTRRDITVNPLSSSEFLNGMLSARLSSRISSKNPRSVFPDSVERPTLPWRFRT